MIQKLLSIGLTAAFVFGAIIHVMHRISTRTSQNA